MDPIAQNKDKVGKIGNSGESYIAIKKMPSEIEVASQHCDTVPNKTKDILDIVKVERIF